MMNRNAYFARSHAPLTDDQIRAAAPSIFAEAKHESRSERYAYIPTIKIVESLRREGFQPFMAAQTVVRDEDRREHAKHVLRLRHASQLATGDSPEILLVNSHDGSSSYQMMGGFFRKVCSNGLVVGNFSKEVRVRHTGDVVDEVVGGAHLILDGFDLIRESKASMEAVNLSEDEQHLFARAALAVRYDTTEGPAPITESQVLRARRSEDAGDDLWATFNRVQESLVRGGLRGRSKNGRHVKTRPINGIDQDIRLNRALWIIADAMQGHKK
ncbi:DUF932 domain-containing protein [Burkholderia gladioli]|uniref:DUF932 domain-containing protein n=1 Tax=Burkholderia gladioli TaxID=28095 RepID=UPI001641E275|nr:DUF932 domain-containing protein [Burkholderia gladioli]